MSRLSTPWIIEHWGTPCAPRLVTARFGGCVSSVDERAKPAFDALNRVFIAFGYTVVSCGCYNCRKIKGSNNWSSHSWAISTDINPADNPWAPWVDGKLVTNLPPALIDYVENELVNADGKQVFFWGGRWTRYDPMHFQLILTPEEISRGILTPNLPEDEMVLQKGDTGNAVVVYQKRLNAWMDKYHSNWDRLDTDGVFGSLTETAVKKYQEAAQLSTQDGRIDGITADLLARYDEDKVGLTLAEAEELFLKKDEVPEVPVFGIETESVEVIKSIEVIA